MQISKENLILEIEAARIALNESIDSKEEYDKIYENSTELDRLIGQYIVAGY